MHTKKGLKIFLLLMSILVILVAMFYAIQSVYVANEKIKEPTKITIDKGSGLDEISELLKNQSLIKSSFIFKIYSVILGYAHALKPGTYLVEPNMSMHDLIFLLYLGSQNEIEVVIPEGLTIKDIDYLLWQKGIIKKGELASISANEFIEEYVFLTDEISSLEGFLFPDTYRLFYVENAEDIARRLLDNFKHKAWRELGLESFNEAFQDSGIGENSIYEVLIVASLIEKEVIGINDRKLVSGIIWNRKEINMPLQIDATLSYSKCGGALLECENRKVFRKDLEVDSYHNTYKYVGLPPTPIANPGIEAIKSAIHPEFSQYWFYLSDPDSGETIFSKNLEEHNINRAKYLGL